MGVNDVSRQPADDITAILVKLIGVPTSSAWREDALARAVEMSTLLLWLKEESKLDNKVPLVTAVQVHLQAAQESANEKHNWVLRTISGAIIERTLANLNAAYINLLRLAPLDYLQSNVPNLLVQAREQLGPDDPRLRQLELLAKEANRRKLEHPERNAIVAAIQGAGEHWRRAQMRVRSFRNVIIFTAAMIMLLVVIVGMVGSVRPTALPLCFQPEQQIIVCPTGQAAIRDGQPGGQPPSPAAVDDAVRRAVSRWDVALVEFIGLLGATVAATVALRRSRGTTDPYSLPAALAMLKVCTGALTAFLGLLLIRAEFIPGLSALDSSAQIIAWAIVLGYAQQLFTRAVDQQAQNVLSEAQEPTAPPPPSPPATEEVSSQPQPTAPLSQAEGG
jgi:hypothetical protein